MSDQEKDPALRVVDRRWWARGEGAASDGETLSRKPTYVEDLEQRVKDAANELQNYMVEHKRSLEEFEQVKARLRRDMAKELERGKRQVLAELLEVVDNLERAIAAASSGGEHQKPPDPFLNGPGSQKPPDPFLNGPGSAAASQSGESPDAVNKLAQGVCLVRDQFLAKLQGFGVMRVPSLGEKFDASRHEAVTTARVPSPEQDGTIVSVIKEGYGAGDDLLRPASVVVGSYEPR